MECLVIINKQCGMILAPGSHAQADEFWHIQAS